MHKVLCGFRRKFVSETQRRHITVKVTKLRSGNDPFSDFLFIFRTGDRSPYGKHCRRKKGSPPSLKDCPDERLDRRRIPPRRRSSLRYAPPGQRSFRTVLSSVDRKFSLFPSCFSCLQHSIFFSFVKAFFHIKRSTRTKNFPEKRRSRILLVFFAVRTC